MIYGFLEKENENSNKHFLIGIFTRILKLLCLNIKPVFVFDGKPPDLKR